MSNRLNPGQPRDSQRSRLYDAEHVLRGLRVSTAATRHLTDSVRSSNRYVLRDGQPQALYYPSTESVQDYVDAVTATAWFRRRWGYHRIDVTHAHGGSSHGGFGHIEMGVEHRRSEAVILHEIAHNLSPFTYAFHGPEFAGVLVTLVKHVMGAEHAKALRESFKAKRVRVSMAAVPAPDEARRARADATADRRGFKVRTTTRTAAAKVGTRKPPSRITTVEQAAELGRKAALRGSNWDRAERAAGNRAGSPLRYWDVTKAFSHAYGEVRDAMHRGEIPFVDQN